MATWMRLQLTAFRDDVSGAVAVADIVIVTAILVIGILAGITAYRDSFVQELGDVAVALDHLDQGFTFTVNGVTSEFDDDDALFLADPLGSEPAGISVTVAATELEE